MLIFDNMGSPQFMLTIGLEQLSYLNNVVKSLLNTCFLGIRFWRLC